MLQVFCIINFAQTIWITIIGMKRWLVSTLMLYIATTLLVIASVNYGRLESSSDVFTVLQIADCNKVPCVQGVIPGVSSWDDVTTRFARDAGSIMTANNIDIGADTLTHTTFTADTSEEKIDSITIYFVDSHLAFGTLITRYGTPCKLRVYSSGGVQVIYPQLTAELDISRYFPRIDTNLAADTKVRELDFSAVPNSCELEKSVPDNIYHDKYWHGFMELDKYYEN
jgi:hypothetical protein